MDIFGKKNYILIFIGVVILGIGFYFLGQGPSDNPKSLTYAPLLLTLAFFIIVPMGIIIGVRDKNKGD